VLIACFIKESILNSLIVRFYVFMRSWFIDYDFVAILLLFVGQVLIHLLSSFSSFLHSLEGIWS